MSNLVVLEFHTSYAEGAARALRLASKFEQQVVLQRSLSSWVILVTPRLCALIDTREGITSNRYSANSANGDRDNCLIFQEESAFQDEYRREVQIQLLAEMSDDQDAWSRSNEDGWFYQE